MLFSDPIFLLFFAIYLPLHIFCPPRARIYLIIAGSTVFYAWWRVEYVWLPFALTLIAWAGVAFIERAIEPPARRLRLLTVLFVLFLPLAVFKYSYFLASDVISPLPGMRALLGDVTWLKVPLPLAVSFVTFTLTAFIVDIYRRRFPAGTSFTTLVAYVLFFPHLIAGPILRPHELIPQLARPRPALGASFTLGAALFALGLVKKLVFADTMAGIVDPVFAQGASPSRLEYILAIYGYALQIYCDFSGYTDMAIGLAYMLRIRLPTNFLRPYTAHSLVEFWRLWHITLSHWLRDYLYIALGGNRYGRLRQFANILVTMVLGGLWHGANWTFLLWGFLHGAALVFVHGVARPMRQAGLALPGWLSVLLTFHFVALAWIAFRAPDLSTAIRVATGAFTAEWGDFSGFLALNIFPIMLLLLFFSTHWADRHARVRLAVRRSRKAIVWSVIGIALIMAVTISQGSSAKFIYFDF